MFISQREIPILHEINKKVKFFFLIFVFFFLLIVIRLFYLQVIKGKLFKKISQNNFVQIKEEKAPRGYILDRNGTILADNRIAYDVYLIPKARETENREIVEKLNAKFGWEILTEDLGFSYLPKPLKRDIFFEDYIKIKKYAGELQNIIVDKRPVRNYPYGEFLFHTIGYVSLIDEELMSKPEYSSYSYNDYIGQTGIEKIKEDRLRGANGVNVEIINAFGKSIPQSELKKIGIDSYMMKDLTRITESGKDVKLTIDYSIQKKAEELLKDKTGVIIVMETKTGNLLGMASGPELDPNKFIKGMDKDEWYTILNSTPPILLNRTINATYKTGSTFKIIPVLAGLNDGVITGKTKFKPCKGVMKFYNIKKYCWKKHGHGKLGWYDALVYSCNIFYYQLAERVGISGIVSMSENFNLGKKTGFDLTNELEGLIPSPEWKRKNFRERDQKKWYPPETMDLAIGQGFIKLTPLQVIILYNTVALDGIMVRPRVIVADHPEVPEIVKIVEVDKEIFVSLKDALNEVVNRRSPFYGTGYRATVKGFDVCGKTGTAQVIKIKEYRYTKVPDESDIPYKYRDHAWFVGFAPREDPRITVVVMIEHGGFGGSIAAPIAGEIFNFYYENFYKSVNDITIQ